MLNLSPVDRAPAYFWQSKLGALINVVTCTVPDEQMASKEGAY